MFDDIVKEKAEWYKEIPKIIAEEIVSIQPMINIDYSEELKCPDPMDFEDELKCDTVGTNAFADARQLMGYYLDKDKDVRWGYLCNIAMFLNDRCGITDYNERNKLAKELINLLWG